MMRCSIGVTLLALAGTVAGCQSDGDRQAEDLQKARQRTDYSEALSVGYFEVDDPQGDLYIVSSPDKAEAIRAGKTPPGDYVTDTTLIPGRTVKLEGGPNDMVQDVLRSAYKARHN